MQYRVLGATGLRVSVLSYGASPLGGVFGDVTESDGIRTVHTALDGGINFIDVSPYYGLTKAETVLGKALKSVSRDKYYLATKVGRYGEDEFDFSRERVTRSVDESLQRLGVDYVDIIQCHDIEFVSLDKIVNEALPALREVVRAGKARFIGITGLPLKIFPEVLGRAEVDTILSYCHYALNDTSLETLLPFLKEKRVGIINASPLSMGLLTNKTSLPDWHPAPAELRAACAQAAKHCQARGADISKLAVQFAVANEAIHTTLVGTAKAENIQKNIAWADEPLDEELLSDVQRMLSPIKNQTWPSGLPENN
ncbi:MAG TPA: aldo/keto reductase [Abditibacteriaceae bacterium]|jgi:aryl-alcohol dehydrogenase-like predicted oxidoreductase